MRSLTRCAHLLSGLAALAVIPSGFASTPEWVTRSNEQAMLLLGVMGRYEPEAASFVGNEASDVEITDLRRDAFDAKAADFERTIATYRERLAQEADARVRQDLEILATAASQELSHDKLDRKYFIPFTDVAGLVFDTVQQTLDPQIPLVRQQHLVERLNKYCGFAPGYRPVTELAEERALARMKEDASLRWPYRGQIEKVLNDSDTLISGIDALLTSSKIQGWQRPAHALEKQLREYNRWVHSFVLPRARSDYALPAEVYADRLREFGIDVDPQTLIELALSGFAEIQQQMQVAAVQVALARGLPDSDYPAVIKELKKEVIPAKDLMTVYGSRLADIERMVSAHRIVTLPTRPAMIRLATDAENAQTPAPHMLPPRLVGNTGEYGVFVLSTGMSPVDGQPRVFDDFSHQAAAWSLTAHEARPGHELQFAKMVELGVSAARALFAYNSVNVEGWGLYAEAEIQPYEPIDGQLFALQMRAHRAARAFLDPMVNLGRLSIEDAKAFLVTAVGLSNALATQEVERYAFRMPGQAGSYFYGFQRLMEIRGQAELALGARFDRLAFNDFVLSQGLVPPGLLRHAVIEEFIPSQRAMPRTARVLNEHWLKGEP